jgi:hypothetical protein
MDRGAHWSLVRLGMVVSADCLSRLREFGGLACNFSKPRLLHINCLLDFGGAAAGLCLASRCIVAADEAISPCFKELYLGIMRRLSRFYGPRIRNYWLRQSRDRRSK